MCKKSIINSCEIETINLKTKPFLFIIFGGSGDLSQKKLLPSLYNLCKYDMLHEDSKIISIGRKKIDNQEFSDIIKKSLFTDLEKTENIKSFLKRNSYISTGSEKIGIDELNSSICSLKGVNSHQIIFYLATPPSAASNILKFIDNLDLCEKSIEKKIIIEKPFGVDRDSAKVLNKQLHQIFSENEIYRIDHYLGKETVQNILFFRFGNSIFEPLWNRSYIEKIEITVAEEIGIEKRANFYDKSGILKDIIQNHMLQLIALVTMEPPTSFDANSVRDEKVKIFKSITNMNEEYMKNHLFLGQYSSGKIEGRKINGYLEEIGVDENSKTGTFFSGKFHIDNWRWADVPIYIRAGKRLEKKLTEISITFKTPPLKLFGNDCLDLKANKLVFSIQPDEKISLTINKKYPGMENYPHPVEMNFNYSKIEKTSLSAYERLIIDCIKSDLTLFARQDGIEEMWRVLDPIVDFFDKNPQRLEKYNAGTWGVGEWHDE